MYIYIYIYIYIYMYIIFRHFIAIVSFVPHVSCGTLRTELSND